MYIHVTSFVFVAALLVMIASLRTFSNDKLTFWRESASGINRVAYFLAKDVVDIFSVVIKPAIYLSMFYFLSNPRSSFVQNYIITMVFVYCVTGIAYICAILLQPAPAQLVSTVHFYHCNYLGYFQIEFHPYSLNPILDAGLEAPEFCFIWVWCFCRCRCFCPFWRHSSLQRNGQVFYSVLHISATRDTQMRPSF